MREEGRKEQQGEAEGKKGKEKTMGVADMVERKRRKKKKKKEQKGRGSIGVEEQHRRKPKTEIERAHQAEKRQSIAAAKVALKMEGGDQSDPTACSSAREATVSIALPGSIISNAQTFQLATLLGGQIARAAAIFRVDEIVVFDDPEIDKIQKKSDCRKEIGKEAPGLLLTRILQYLETPQYLRHALIPKHDSLRFVGLLPPLDAPHHLRIYESGPYREGVVLDEITQSGTGSYVDAGLRKKVLIQQSLNPGMRITVAMNSKNGDVMQAVDRSEPKHKRGLYWGYTVRHAVGLNAVFTECPFEGGYDYRIGTSEHGDKVPAAKLTIPKFKHILIVFGGVAGLEESLKLDKNLTIKDVSSLFDLYLNTCPNQGSRTIRTEEAILICLQYFQEPLLRAINGK